MRTFGPFDPSPGYGPAVSAGAAAAQEAASAVPAVVVVEAERLACLDVPPAHAATSAEAPATPASWKIRRRESTLQIVGQAEVVFVGLVSVCHGPQVAVRGYECAMRLLRVAMSDPNDRRNFGDPRGR